MKISPLAPKSYPEMPDINGIEIYVGEAGFYNNRNDLLLVKMTENTQAAGVFTQSLTASAPVEWCRKINTKGRARALVVNAGNSNAFTGRRGTEVVQATATTTADMLDCQQDEIFIASTGVIGEAFSPEKICDNLPKLNPSSWKEAAKAIMTTDTYPKYLTKSTYIGNTKIHINAIAKGSGMIAPNMATMLAFIFTDAAISHDVLKQMISEYTKTSFNSITVDSDTSTSDTLIIFATGTAGNKVITDVNDKELTSFKTTLRELMKELALQIICDGEGATKLIEVRITGAENDDAARKIGLAIANSPLVKTAVTGEDPNWGRIIMAVGKSGQKAERDRLTIKIGNITAAKNGELNPEYKEEQAAEHMKNDKVIFTVDIAVGNGSATVWGCNLTKEYITINADYRS